MVTASICWVHGLGLIDQEEFEDLFRRHAAILCQLSRACGQEPSVDFEEFCEEELRLGHKVADRVRKQTGGSQ